MSETDRAIDTEEKMVDAFIALGEEMKRLRAEIARLGADNAELLAALEEVERWFIYERSSDREWPPFAKVLSAIAKAKEQS